MFILFFTLILCFKLKFLFKIIILFFLCKKWIFMVHKNTFAYEKNLSKFLKVIALTFKFLNFFHRQKCFCVLKNSTFVNWKIKKFQNCERLKFLVKIILTLFLCIKVIFCTQKQFCLWKKFYQNFFKKLP